MSMIEVVILVLWIALGISAAFVASSVATLVRFGAYKNWLMDDEKLNAKVNLARWVLVSVMVVVSLVLLSGHPCAIY